MKSLKKILAIVMAIAIVAAFAGCGSKAEKTSTDADYSKMTIEELKPEIKTVADGKLTIATSPDFAPYEFYTVDDNGAYKLAGFDMSLAKYIADYLGLELEVVPMDFDGVLAELAAKSVDIGLAGLSPDPTRVDKMDFSDIYYEGGQSFVTVSDKASKFTALADSNKPELKIGAQNGSIQMDLANKNSPDADIVSLVKVTDIVAELVAGTLDGAYIETAVADSYAKNYPQLKIVCSVPYEAEGSAVGVSKGNAALLAGVNLAVAQLKKDGLMDQYVTEANELAAGNIYEGVVNN